MPRRLPKLWWERLPPYAPEIVMLPAGTKLYHGTSRPRFTLPKSPAWLTDTLTTAEVFTGWHEGYSPRIVHLRTTRPLMLFLLRDTVSDFHNLMKGIDVPMRSDLYDLLRLEGFHDVERMPDDQLVLARRVCESGYDGWFRTNALQTAGKGPGNEILVCRPRQVLRHEYVTPVRNLADYF